MGENMAVKTEQMNSEVYERHHGHYSDFEGANGQCAQCGVPTYNAPDIHDAHPIQMQYTTESDLFCEACFFDGYDRSGYEIAQPETGTFYQVRVGHKRLFFENWQAASGFARRNDDAEYYGEREVETAMLETADE